MPSWAINSKNFQYHIKFNKMEETSKNNETAQLGIGAVSTRYFFVCTMGKNPNGTIGFNSFDIQTTYGHPTLKRCIEISNEKFPNMYEVTLISISEIYPEDWKVFVSEQ